MIIDNCQLTKRERIVSRKLIETLFGGGDSRSLVAFPLRVVYMKKDCAKGDTPVQMLVSVPKKRFHHAVDRNRVKRQVREAYRQHKQLLWQSMPADQQLLAAFVWLSDRHLPTADVSQRVASLIRRVAEKVKVNSE